MQELGDVAAAQPGWEQGAELSYVRGLLKYWADGFDWRLQERRLNEFAHFRGEIDGVRIHFVPNAAVGSR
jgi:hypothetical protein